MIIYPGDREEYFTFITAEAYECIKRWMEFRRSFGEQINGESWIMRDIWQTTQRGLWGKMGACNSSKKTSKQCHKAPNQ